jgi:hypothetical protein
VEYAWGLYEHDNDVTSTHATVSIVGSLFVGVWVSTQVVLSSYYP